MDPRRRETCRHRKTQVIRFDPHGGDVSHVWSDHSSVQGVSNPGTSGNAVSGVVIRRQGSSITTRAVEAAILASGGHGHDVADQRHRNRPLESPEGRAHGGTKASPGAYDMVIKALQWASFALLFLAGWTVSEEEDFCDARGTN
eukprot:scaffold1284_cov402-Pavlova_lutheri.AAC.4